MKLMPKDVERNGKLLTIMTDIDREINGTVRKPLLHCLSA